MLIDAFLIHALYHNFEISVFLDLVELWMIVLVLIEVVISQFFPVSRLPFYVVSSTLLLV